VVVHRWNSEYGENGEGHKGLDWFRPPESKTLRPVCGGIMREWGSPLEWSSRPPYMVNGLGLHSRSMDPHRHRLQIRKAILCDYRVNPAIRGSTGGAKPRPRKSLAPQARRILRDLDKVFRSLPRSSGLWIRSSGPLAGRRGF
jgi:hypothetical protein